VFLGYSNLHKGYKCLDISTGRLYISRDIVFDETVFPFALLHSNAGARLREEINLLPLSLQPFNLHFHEGHELQGPGDVDPTNATNTAAESFLQSADQDFTSDDESSVFPAPGTGIDEDFPASGSDPGDAFSGADSPGTDPVLPVDPHRDGPQHRLQCNSSCCPRLRFAWAGLCLANVRLLLCRPHLLSPRDLLWLILRALLHTQDYLDLLWHLLILQDLLRCLHL
jgi:hypothetical protein